MELKDSGVRQSFETGAIRDTEERKPMLELIPPWSLFAWGWIMEAGAKKYDARNWEKGMPISRYISSGKRHLEKYQAGFRDEPHLWMALWNIGAAVHTQVLVYLGIYPKEFYDLPNHVGRGQAPILSTFEQERVDEQFPNRTQVNIPGGVIEVDDLETFKGVVNKNEESWGTVNSKVNNLLDGDGCRFHSRP